MNNSTLDISIALGDMDDALVSEAANASAQRRHYLPRLISAAAVIAVTVAAALVVPKLIKGPDDDKTAVIITVQPTQNNEPTETATAEPTAEPADDTPEATSEPTPLSTGSAPTSEPSVTEAPGVTSEPTATAAVTPKATLTPKPTSLTTPRPTPSPTGGPQPTPEPTPVPTTEPTPTWPPVETTGEPGPGPEQITFTSLSAFISAVQAQEDPLLSGIDCYYYPAELPSGAELRTITVSDTDIDLTFVTTDMKSYRLIWYRRQSPDHINDIANNEPGQWYGNVYVPDRPNDQAAINAYFTQYGVLFRVVLSPKCGVEDAVNFCSVTRHTI
ncbi:MAG: hypothetical protein J5772_07625 [Clostridia bacterium]|nr:hypothetical protein [Clostridia bacterium]